MKSIDVQRINGFYLSPTVIFLSLKNIHRKLNASNKHFRTCRLFSELFRFNIKHSGFCSFLIKNSNILPSSLSSSLLPRLDDVTSTNRCAPHVSELDFIECRFASRPKRRPHPPLRLTHDRLPHPVWAQSVAAEETCGGEGCELDLPPDS